MQFFKQFFAEILRKKKNTDFSYHKTIIIWFSTENQAAEKTYPTPPPSRYNSLFIMFNSKVFPVNYTFMWINHIGNLVKVDFVTTPLLCLYQKSTSVTIHSRIKEFSWCLQSGNPHKM